MSAASGCCSIVCPYSMENLLATPLTHEIVATNFAFFRPEEVKHMSVKKITSPVAFDSQDKPVPE